MYPEALRIALRASYEILGGSMWFGMYPDRVIMIVILVMLLYITSSW